jgi:nitrite reductase/ring-hydroxylating ferredoxin subunit
VKDLAEVCVGRLYEIDDPGCREFHIGEGDWPFKGFVVRRGAEVFAYQNHCVHAGHPLNWQPHSFLTPDGEKIICASHGAEYDIETGAGVSALCRGKALRSLQTEIRDGQVYVSGPDEQES